MHAAGTAALTGTIVDQLVGGFQQAFDTVKSARGKAHSAIVSVVEEHRRPAELWMAGVGDAGHVEAVAEGEEGEYGESRVFHRVDAAHHVAFLAFQYTRDFVGHLQPDPGRFVRGRRKLEGLGSE